MLETEDIKMMYHIYSVLKLCNLILLYNIQNSISKLSLMLVLHAVCARVHTHTRVRARARNSLKQFFLNETHVTYI